MDFVRKVDAVMQDIEYGWVDKAGRRHENDMDDYSENYALQLPDELLKSKLGVCWDQVELERKLFSERNIKVRTFFIVHYDGEKCPTHTFVIFNYGGDAYWYEHSWAPMRGLHKYTDEQAALSNIRMRFIDDELHNNYNPDNLMVYEYGTIHKKLSCPEFYQHCEKGKKIDIETAL